MILEQSFPCKYNNDQDMFRGRNFKKKGIHVFLKSNYFHLVVQETESLYNMLVKKYSFDKDMWVGFALFFFKNQRVESARKLLDRSLKSLQKKHRKLFILLTLSLIIDLAIWIQDKLKQDRIKVLFENL